MERPPFTAEQVSGGGVTLMQLAMTDALGRPYPEIMQSLVLGPIGMTNSAYEQPLLGRARPARGARARRPRAGDGREVARLSGAGRRRAVDDADRPREVRDRSAATALGRSTRC